MHLADDPCNRNVQGATKIAMQRCMSMTNNIGSAVPTSEELRAKLEETVTSMPSTELPNKAKQSAWNTNQGQPVQGAAEIVLKRCVSVMDDAGSVVPISEELRAKLEGTVTSLASTGLRTLALTMRDMDESMAEGSSNYWENPPDEQLTLCCIVAIKVSV